MIKTQHVTLEVITCMVPGENWPHTSNSVQIVIFQYEIRLGIRELCDLYKLNNIHWAVFTKADEVS
jgi:hypothetical protein